MFGACASFIKAVRSEKVVEKHETGKNAVTRQRPEVWEELKSSGIYRVKKEYIEEKTDTITDYYLELYRWYTKTAKKYLTIPPGCEYPIWLSLGEEFMLQPVENTVILKLEIPEGSI